MLAALAASDHNYFLTKIYTELNETIALGLLKMKKKESSDVENTLSL